MLTTAAPDLLLRFCAGGREVQISLPCSSYHHPNIQYTASNTICIQRHTHSSTILHCTTIRLTMDASSRAVPMTTMMLRCEVLADRTTTTRVPSGSTSVCCRSYRSCKFQTAHILSRAGQVNIGYMQLIHAQLHKQDTIQATATYACSPSPSP